MKRLTNNSGVIDVQARETFLSRAIRRVQRNLGTSGAELDKWNLRQGTGRPFLQNFKEHMLGCVVVSAILLGVILYTSW